MDYDWNAWLSEKIWWNSGAVYLPRYKAIWRFVTYGLIPFISEKGYFVQTTQKDLASRIATGLFNNRGKHYTDSDWSFGQVNDRPREADVWQWNYAIPDDDWDAFWAKWGCWGDLDLENARGEDRRIDIRAYIWTQINLEQSVQTQIVNEYLGVVYVEEGSGSRRTAEDHYIREAAESGEWGGYRR